MIFIGLSPLMLIGSALEGRLAAKRDFKRAVEAFDSDLAGLIEEVHSEQATEITHRLAEHPATADLISSSLHRGELLWSRRPDVDDFGQLRLGLGTLPTRSSFKVGARNKAPHELTVRVKEAVSALSHVAGVPVVAGLRDTAIGIAGPRSAALGSARAQVAQAVALHSPAELVCAAHSSPRLSRTGSGSSGCPHAGSPHSPLAARSLVSSPAAATVLVGELEELLPPAGRKTPAHPQSCCSSRMVLR